MKTNLVFIVFIILSNIALPQQVVLKGLVSIHNSKHNTGSIEYISNAYITAPNAKPATTDDSGTFELEFVGVEVGTDVKLTIEKTNYEVTDTTDLKVTLGKILPVRIYMALKGELLKAQTAIKNTSIETLHKERDALIAKLRASEQESREAIAELEERFNQEIADRFEAEELLYNKVLSLEKKLPEFALNLASQNLDFANELYIKAYEYYISGDIEKAIEILDDEKLEQSYQEAVKNKAEGKGLENIGKEVQERENLNIARIINTVELKAKSYLLSFDFPKAIQAYEKIISMHKENQFDEEKLAYWYEITASVYLENGKYKTAFEYFHKSLSIREEILSPMHPDIATSNNNIAISYYDLGDYENALKYHHKAIKIAEKVLHAEHPDLATYYNNIALTFNELENFKNAFKYHHKAIDIREKIDNKNPDLSISYNNIALTYMALKDYQNALMYQRRAIDTILSNEILDPRHLDMASYYNNIAVTYRYLKNYEDALKYFLKSINIREEILEPQHPNLAHSYNNVALLFGSLKDYKNAIEYHQKAIKIAEEIFDSTDLNLGSYYSGMALTFCDSGNFSQALVYYLKSNRIKEKVLDSKNPSLANSYNNIASTYAELKDYDLALEYFEKAENIAKNLDSEDFDYISFYVNIAFMYQRKKDYQKALKYYSKANDVAKHTLHSKRPLIADTYTRIGIVYEKTGDYEESIKQYNKAYKAYPQITQTYYYNYIGLAYAKNRQFDRAENAFREYERRNPHNGESFRNWAMFYALQNNKDKALSNLQKAIELGYNDLEWIETDESLKNIREEKIYKDIVKKIDKKEK